MKVEELLKQQQKKSNISMIKEGAKQYDRPLTKTGIVRVFNNVFIREDWGYPAVLTKEQNRMLSGFIKILLKSMADKQVYKYIEQYVVGYSTLKNVVVTTLKGKPYTLGSRPQLKDLLYCRESIFSILTTPKVYHSTTPEKVVHKEEVLTNKEADELMAKFLRGEI